ncbi:hypothetical protein GCM10027355_35290 [Haloplanus salinarum]
MNQSAVRIGIHLVGTVGFVFGKNIMISLLKELNSGQKIHFLYFFVVYDVEHRHTKEIGKLVASVDQVDKVLDGLHPSSRIEYCQSKSQESSTIQPQYYSDD